MTRTLVYEGNEGWLHATLEQSACKPGKPITLPFGNITETERREEAMSMKSDLQIICEALRKHGFDSIARDIEAGRLLGTRPTSGTINQP